jgi:arylsulfatase A
MTMERASWVVVAFEILIGTSLATNVGFCERLRLPNVILINADNLGYGDLGVYGSKLHRTPRIDRLASEGVRFTDFYAASAVCTSSRAALLTGCYPLRNGMHEFDWDGSVLRPVSPYGLHADEVTLAEILRDRGYATACIGKWHLGDQADFLPSQHGFDCFLGLPYSDEMDHTIAKFKWPPMPLVQNDRVIEAPANLETMTRRYTEKVQQLIQQYRDRPFFIYLPHMSPGSRTDPVVGSEFKGKSQNGPYGDAIEELDWSTGAILDTLTEYGLSNDTLVIWTADNGAPPARGTEFHGSNAPLAERTRYDAAEGGLRVPFIARWPNHIPANSVCKYLATNMDLFTTIAKLAGASIPVDQKIDGKDITPLLFGEPNAQSSHDAFFYYFGGQLQAVRAGKWKLHLPLEKPLLQLGMGQLGVSVTRRSNRLFGPAQSARLYDLEADIGETNEISSSHPETVSKLLTLAKQAQREIGDIDSLPPTARLAGKIENPKPMLLPDK